jgi:tetratricopeptide (TPR) repeat protein
MTTPTTWMRIAAIVLLSIASLATGAARAAVDLDALWNFADPAASEQRFRSALDGANGDDALVLRTQLARALALQDRFDAAQAELDVVQSRLAGASTEVAVHLALERGRTLRSADRPADAAPLFERAFALADRAGLERLAADALHMSALAAPSLDERLAWNRRTVDYARRATDPRARGWDAAAFNNMGSDLRDAGRLDNSLAAFREALAAYERKGRADDIRFARWQVANVLRLKGRVQEALAIQLALEREAAAAGEPDAEIYDELAWLHDAVGDATAAASARARAAQLRAPPRAP